MSVSTTSRPSNLSLLSGLSLVALLAACGDDAPIDTSLTSSVGLTENPQQTSTAPTTAPDSETLPTSGTTTTTDATATSDPSTGTSTGAGTSTTTNPDPDTSTGTTDPITATDPSSSSEGGSSSTGSEPCPAGQIVCDGNNAQVCDGMGGFTSEMVCDVLCAPDLGCVACIPGEDTCEGNVAHKCKEDGSGYDDTVCDADLGILCNAGACEGACLPDNLGNSYIGCDYYSLVTPTQLLAEGLSSTFSFAVIVSNVSNAPATIKVTRGNMDVTTANVPANSVQVIQLPWINQLMMNGPSLMLADGAYRVRSTQPITLYQYSPLDYTKNGQFSYVNDASLLMPTNAYGKETIVISRNGLLGNSSSYSVVAREDNTTITLVPSASGGNIKAGGGVAANGTGVIVLNAGDVLQVNSGYTGPEPDKNDTTGTRVQSDKPAMVIGSHYCTYIPYNVQACDHLEELNLPIDNLAKEYFVSTPFVKPPNQNPQIKARIVRIIATEDATTLTYDPPQNGAPTMLALAGQHAEIQTTADFKITSNNKIAVAEYMLGQNAGGNTGDPAMTIAVPVEQFRTELTFHAPTNYESSFVNITAETGSNIVIDGAPAGAFAPIGATGYGVLRMPISNAGDGNHTITGDKPFGVQVYGYGQYTSYWYPGGLDLTVVPQ